MWLVRGPPPIDVDQPDLLCLSTSKKRPKSQTGNACASQAPTASGAMSVITLKGKTTGRSTAAHLILRIDHGLPCLVFLLPRISERADSCGGGGDDDGGVLDDAIRHLPLSPEPSPNGPSAEPPVPVRGGGVPSALSHGASAACASHLAGRDPTKEREAETGRLQLLPWLPPHRLLTAREGEVAPLSCVAASQGLRRLVQPKRWD